MNVLRAAELQLPTHVAHEISCIAFHPASSALVAAIGSRIYVVELAGRTSNRGIVSVDAAAVTNLAASRDAFSAITEDGTVWVWDWKTLRLLLTIPPNDTNTAKHSSMIEFAASAPILFLTSAKSKYITGYDMRHSKFGKPAVKLTCKQPPSAIVVHPTESLIATYSNGVVYVYEFLTGALHSSAEDVGRLLQANNLAQLGSVFLSFGADRTLCIGTEAGAIVTYRIEDKSLSLLCSRVIAGIAPLAAVQLHPRWPVVITVAVDGTIASWDLNGKASGLLQVGFVTELEAVDRMMMIPEYSRPAPARLSVSKLSMHPRANLLAFTYNNAAAAPGDGAIPSVDGISRHIVFHLVDTLFPLRASLPLSTSPNRQLPSTTATPERVYPPLCYSLQESHLVAHSTTKIEPLADIPLADIGGNALLPFKIVHGGRDDRFLTFYRKSKIPDENIFSIRGTDYRYTLVGYDGAIRRGSDGFFLNSDDDDDNNRGGGSSTPDATTNERSCEVLVLAETGESIETVRASFDGKSAKYEATTYALGQVFHRVFPAPMANGRAALLYDAASKTLMRSINAAERDLANPYAVDPSVRLQLAPYEMVADVCWPSSCFSGRRANDGSGIFGAVMTTHSILIIDQQLRVVASTRADNRLPRANFYSCAWAGNTLLFTTDTQLRYLTLDGCEHPLTSVPFSGTCITAVWEDRVALAHTNHSRLELVFQPVGLLEPVLLGELAYAAQCSVPFTSPELRKTLVDVVARFDCSRISRYLIDRLQQQGFSDIALALIRTSPLYPTRFKLNLALEAAQFRTAYSILMQERDLLKVESASDITQMFKLLGDACSKYGLFQLAERCYQESNAHLSLLELYSYHAATTQLESIKEPSLANAIMHLLEDCSGLASRRKATIKDRDFNCLAPSYTPTLITVASIKEELNAAAAAAAAAAADGDAVHPHCTPAIGIQDCVEKWFCAPVHCYAMAEPFDFPRAYDLTEDYVASNAIPRSPFTALGEAIAQQRKRAAEHPRTSTHSPREPDPRTEVASRRQLTITSCSSVISKSDEESASVGADDANRGTDVDSNVTVSCADLSDGEEEDEIADDEPSTPSSSMSSSHGSLPKAASSNTPVTPPPPRLSIGTMATPPPPPPTDPTSPPPPGARVHAPALSEILQAAAQLKQASQDFQDAKQLLDRAIEHMEQGSLVTALVDVNHAIALLHATSDAARRRKELKVCVAYKLAVHLMIHVRLRENASDKARGARLLKLLASVPIRPDHRVVFTRIAADRNLDAENFGVADELYKILLTRNEVDTAFLQTRRQECENMKLSNKCAPTESNGQFSPRSKICYLTFEIIEGSFVWCRVCDATYAEEAKKPNEACTFCGYAKLARRVTPTIVSSLPPALAPLPTPRSAVFVPPPVTIAQSQ